MNELHFASEIMSLMLLYSLYHVDVEVKVRGIYLKGGKGQLGAMKSDLLWAQW